MRTRTNGSTGFQSPHRRFCYCDAPTPVVFSGILTVFQSPHRRFCYCDRESMGLPDSAHLRFNLLIGDSVIVTLSVDEARSLITKDVFQSPHRRFCYCDSASMAPSTSSIGCFNLLIGDSVIVTERRAGHGRLPPDGFNLLIGDSVIVTDSHGSYSGERMVLFQSPHRRFCYCDDHHPADRLQQPGFQSPHRRFCYCDCHLWPYCCTLDSRRAC